MSLIEGEGVSVREAARIMGCSERYVWKLVENGTIQHYKKGRNRLVVPKLDMIEGNQIPALPVPAAVPPELDQFRGLVEALMRRQEERHHEEMQVLRQEVRRLDSENGDLRGQVRQLRRALSGMEAVLRRVVGGEDPA